MLVLEGGGGLVGWEESVLLEQLHHQVSAVVQRAPEGAGAGPAGAGGRGGREVEDAAAPVVVVVVSCRIKSQSKQDIQHAKKLMGVSHPA